MATTAEDNVMDEIIDSCHAETRSEERDAGVPGSPLTSPMDILQLLTDLVTANSVNPSLVPGAAGEAQAADVARRALTRAGLDVVQQMVRPGRPNVIGVLEGRAPGPSVMFCGHLDTVGVEGMVDPFRPRVEHGRL